MQSILANPYILLIARLMVGGIFVMYGVDKISAAKDFAHSILLYNILPHFAVNIMALIMPWIEVICGLMLILGVRLRAAAFLSSSLLVIFMMAILSAMARQLEINCGCSANPEIVGWGKILEDLGYLVLAVWIYFFPKREFTLESFVTNSAPPQPVIQDEPSATN